MTSPSRRPRVLRIATIVDGKIVQERLVRPGQSVSVGTAATNTLVVPHTHTDIVEHRLIEASDAGYRLHVREGMTGKLSSGGAVTSLAKRTAEASPSGRDGAMLPLTIQDRGKVVIGRVAVLFQFIDPPPVSLATPLQQMDFRPRLLEEDDPVFLGFLGVWSSLALVLVVWVWNTEPQAYEMTDLPDRIAKLTVIPRAPAPAPEPEIDEPVDAEPIEVVRDRAPAPPSEPTEAPAPRPRSEEELRQDVLQRSAILVTLLGTKGDSPTEVADMWAPDERGLQDLDEALAGAGGVTLSAANAGPRTGGGGTAEAADIDDLVGVGGGDARSIEGPSVTVEGSVRSGEAEILATEGAAGSVEKTIRANAGHLNYCYEKRLKVLPGLAGRVDLSWEVVDGAVVGMPLVVSNTTGDEELARCVQQRVRRWHFEGFAGEANNPFIFQPK